MRDGEQEEVDKQLLPAKEEVSVSREPRKEKKIRTAPLTRRRCFERLEHDVGDTLARANVAADDGSRVGRIEA
jgi:hypothetical protein